LTVILTANNVKPAKPLGRLSLLVGWSERGRLAATNSDYHDLHLDSSPRIVRKRDLSLEQSLLEMTAEMNARYQLVHRYRLSHP
jgi:hypothetical protein